MQMYVAGEWRGAAREEEVRSPYDGEVVDTVPVASADDARAALAAAEEGARAMRALTPWERSEILRHAASALDEQLPELARTIALEVGKPLLEATNEAKRIPDLLRVSASEGARMHGETVPVDAAPGGAGKVAFTLRQPCGIVVAITPFNYPALLVTHKVGPALAAGNAVVLKPARQTPLTALFLTRVLLERRAAGARAPVPHRSGLGARRRPLLRSARAQDQLHRLDGGRGADHPRRGRQAALARAGVELPADRAPGCGSRAGRGRHAHRRLRQRGSGLHLGPASPRGGRGLRRPRRCADAARRRAAHRPPARRRHDARAGHLGDRG